MKRNEGQTDPHNTQPSIDPKEHIDFASAPPATSVDLLKRRLEGVLEDIKGVLSYSDDRGEAHRRLYFAATAIDKVVEYLGESESQHWDGCGA